MHRHTREKKKSEFARSYSIPFYLLLGIIGILAGVLIVLLIEGDLKFSRFSGGQKPDIKITDEKDSLSSDAIDGPSENVPPTNDRDIIEKNNAPLKELSLKNSPNNPSVIYSVQTGSYANIESAKRHYDTLIKTLDKKYLDYLRIEKVGEYYSVRVGKFAGYPEAKNYVNDVSPQLPDLLIIKTSLNGDRIIDLYYKS